MKKNVFFNILAIVIFAANSAFSLDQKEQGRKWVTQETTRIYESEGRIRPREEVTSNILVESYLQVLRDIIKEEYV